MNGRPNIADMDYNMMTTSRDYTKDVQFKFLIIGDFGVGKTAIVRRYVDGRFSSKYKITIGADFALKHITRDETHIKLQIWDIAGNERFGYMTRVYFKYAVAAVVVFDLTRSTTIQSASKWLRDLREKVTLSDGTAVPVVLLANKCDIYNSSLPTDSINKLCKEYRIDAWFATSAKDNVNIDQAFNFLIDRSLQVTNCEPTREGIALDEKSIFNKNIYKNQGCCKIL
ncbi:ras-related protein Rab-32-like [Homalodisca vitripennis]|nr:ras-related protein Rab-32-like [Homalodisca vitripennis]